MLNEKRERDRRDETIIIIITDNVYTYFKHICRKIRGVVKFFYTFFSLDLEKKNVE